MRTRAMATGAAQRQRWRGLRWGRLVLALALAAAAAAAQEADRRATDVPSAETADLDLSAPLPLDPLVRTGTTRSGVRFYVRRNSRPEGRAELRLVVRSGSLQEDERQLGLAHFVEHMAFNGTEHFAKNEAIEYLRSIGMEFGADVNAFTGFDRTVYQLRVPTDDEEAVERGLLILEDWASGLTFAAEEIDRERGVVIEEWRGGRGAAARISDQHLPVLLAGSPRATRRPIGDPDLLRTFPHEDLIRYYRTWYRPERMAIVAVGDFDPERMQRRIERAFRKLGSRQARRQRAESERPAEIEDRVELSSADRFSLATDPEIQRPRLEHVVRHAAPRGGSIGDFRDDLIDSLFLRMFNQRLGELLQQAEPPFLSAGAGLQRVDASTVLFTLAMSPQEGLLLEGLDSVAVEAERVRRHGFLDSELERQRGVFLRAFERAWEERDTTSSGAFVADYIDHFVDAEPYPDAAQRLDLVRRLLPAITLEEINARSQRWSSGDDRVTLLTAPDSEAEDLPDGEAILDRLEAVREREVEPWVDEVSTTPLMETLPEPGEVTTRRQIEELDLHHWSLSNGIEVYLKVTDFKRDEVLLRAFSPGGTSLVSEEEFPSAVMSQTVLGISGLGEHSMIELGKMLSDKVVSISPTLDEEGEGFQGGGSPQDLETLFQLLHLQATAPRDDPEAFASFENRMAGLVRNRRSRPEIVFGEAIEEALYDDHPRRQPFDEAFLERIDHDTVLRVHRERFADLGDFTFVIVGAFELDAMEALVERYLASLPSEGRREAPRDVGVRIVPGEVTREIAMGVEEKAQVQLVLSGAFEQSVEERLRLHVMVEVLRSRLRDRVREDLGGTYGVGLSASTSHWPTESFRLTVSFGADPERIDELVEVVFEEMDRMRREAPEVSELEKVRETERRNRETALRQNGFWLGTLAYSLERGEDLTNILTFDQRLSAVDVETIRQAAGKYLKRENLGRFVLRPAAAGGDASPQAGSQEDPSQIEEEAA